MNKERERKLKPKHQAMLRRYKLRKGCQQCGYKKYHGALQFHHTDPAEKKQRGQRAIYPQWSPTKIRKELAKCIVLCANCHAERHADE